MTTLLWMAAAFCAGILVEYALRSRTDEAERATLLHRHEDDCHDWFWLGVTEGRAARATPELDRHINEALAVITEWEPSDDEIRGWTA